MNRLRCMFAVASLHLAGPAPVHADLASDYAALTAGLTNLPGSGGTPGTRAMNGRTAFPLFTANADGTDPVVAAGYWNDNPNAGRGLALAHTGWQSTTDDMGIVMSNMLRWAARRKPNAVITQGADMSAKYNETSHGGLALSVVEC